jgi:hypothetical protein
VHTPVRAEPVEVLAVRTWGFDKLSPNGDGGPDPHGGLALIAP